MKNYCMVLKGPKDVIEKVVLAFTPVLWKKTKFGTLIDIGDYLFDQDQMRVTFTWKGTFFDKFRLQKWFKTLGLDWA